jgi:hypothetical protein
MSPYEILQVPINANAAEIKRAYRLAVKKYHPDVSGTGHNEMIALVNEAYDLLSDPERRRTYDAGLYSEPQYQVEEDPKEIWRQAHIRKSREQARQRMALNKKIFNKLRMLNILITIIAGALAIDEFLPTLTFDERGIDQWILIRRVKGMAYRIRFFQTNNFTFAVPVGTIFDYDFKNPAPIDIQCSPIFRVPTEVHLHTGGKEFTFEPSRTIYSFKFPFHYLLLLGCALSLPMKRFSAMAYSLSYAPLLFAILAWAMFNFY